jgi:hypothetical protein
MLFGQLPGRIKYQLLKPGNNRPAARKTSRPKSAKPARKAAARG